MDAKVVKINGVRVISDKSRVPPYLRDLMFREAYEDTERNILLKMLKPGVRVLEIGTGIGFIALLAAKICGEKNVWTFEANPRVESLIRDNFHLNGNSPRLTMRAITIDGRDLSFNAAENIISSSAFDRDGASESITVKSEVFRDVLDNHNPDVLIMDVEGGEYELLMQSQHLPNDILVELHPHIIGQEKVDEIVAYLDGIGYVIRASDRKSFHFSKI